jgi:hypothetical protein
VKRFARSTSISSINISSINRGQQAMGGNGNKAGDIQPVDKALKDNEKPGKSPPGLSEDDDVEDGDMATPKRDRDDEQQGL